MQGSSSPQRALDDRRNRRAQNGPTRPGAPAPNPSPSGASVATVPLPEEGAHVAGYLSSAHHQPGCSRFGDLCKRVPEEYSGLRSSVGHVGRRHPRALVSEPRRRPVFGRAPQTRLRVWRLNGPETTMGAASGSLRQGATKRGLPDRSPDGDTFPTKAEASRWLSLAEADLVRGTFVHPSLNANVTVAEWLGEWRASHSLHKRPTTLVRDESAIPAPHPAARRHPAREAGRPTSKPSSPTCASRSDPAPLDRSTGCCEPHSTPPSTLSCWSAPPPGASSCPK
jgi:hypothetical protein